MSKKYYDGTLISTIYHPNEGIAYRNDEPEINNSRIDPNIVELRNVRSNIYNLFPQLEHVEIN
jgi:hypothetical protein